LWRSPAFHTQALTRYQQLRNTTWADSWFTSELDTQAARISAATARNFERWRATFAADRVQFAPGLQGVAAWKAAVDDLRSWTVTRLHWLDAALSKESMAAAAPASDNSAGGPAGPAASGITDAGVHNNNLQSANLVVAAGGVRSAATAAEPAPAPPAAVRGR
jgi:hypothetical protein